MIALKHLPINQIVSSDIQKHSNWIYNLIELSDHRLASSSTDGCINIYNKQTFSIDIQIKEEFGYWYCLSEIKPLRLIASSVYQCVKIWSLSDTDYTLEKEINTGEDTFYVRAVLGLTNNKFVLSFNSPLIQIVSSKNYKKIKTFRRGRNGEDGSDRTKKVALGLLELSKNRLVAGSQDGDLMFYDLIHYKIILKLTDIECYSQNSIKMIDKRRLIVGGCNEINIIDVEDYQLITKLQDATLETVYCFSVIDKYNILVGGKYNLFLLNGAIRIIDLGKHDEDKSTITAMVPLYDNTILCARARGQVHCISYNL